MQRRSILLTLLALGALGATAAGATASELSEPEKTFEYIWQTYDRNYALFGAKNVDWNALYATYRPRVTPETTDEALFDLLAAMLGHLNDNHVRLRTGERRFQSGILGEMEMTDFSLDLVREKYLRDGGEERADGLFHFGWLSPSIGYFHFRSFGRAEQSIAAVDEIVRTFKDAAGIVIDVRANGGGDDRVGKAIADRFADRKRLYMTTQVRNGPEHEDFSTPKYWYVEPGGALQFTRPVILLTHRHSVSAAENFALALRVLPHVTVVGDTTSGVFADVYGDRAPNGWQFSVSFKLFKDYQGICWEGIGVPADLRQTNREVDIEQGRDRVIDLAMALIDSGALAAQNEEGSLIDLRDSLVSELRRTMEGTAASDAIAAVSRRRASRPHAYYVDEDELAELLDELLDAGKTGDAVAVATMWTDEFPGSARAHERLGNTLVAAGDRQRARRAYARALETNRASYPWEIEARERVQQLQAGREILAGLLENAARRGGLEAEIARYEKQPDTFYVNERSMNGLGYRLLSQEEIDEAIAVFQINVRAFPDSWNVYDSLGEAYMIRGDRDQAIANYERSIEINPQNTNGIAILKRLREEPSQQN